MEMPLLLGWRTDLKPRRIRHDSRELPLPEPSGCRLALAESAPLSQSSDFLSAGRFEALVGACVSRSEEENVASSKLDTLVARDLQHVFQRNGIRTEVIYLDAFSLCIRCKINKNSSTSDALFCPRLKAVAGGSLGRVDFGLRYPEPRLSVSSRPSNCGFTDPL